jgi:hypothetical protein
LINYFLKTRKIIDNFIINSTESFSVEDIKEEILNKNSILHISPELSISEYLSSLEKNGILFYSASDNKYYPKDTKILKIETSEVK